jgi:hypothetical protein
MSAAMVGTKTLAATAMEGEKTINNQLKAACLRGHAAAKLPLLPPNCSQLQNCRCCCCAAAVAAAAVLPPS